MGLLDGFMNYDLSGKTRSMPLHNDYMAQVSQLVRGLGDGYDVQVTSGGQARKGSGGKRTGSTRHDVDHTGHSHTADFVLTQNGKPVRPGDNPALYERFFESAAPLFPGMGHYDWGIHVGGGKPAFWGPDTTSQTADPRFAAAYQRGRNGAQSVAHETMTALGKEPQMASAQRRPQPQPVAISSQNGPRSTTRYNDNGRELAGGFMGKLFPNMTADRQDRLALALGGLSMNPNQALMETVQDRLSDRRETRRDRQQGSRTAEWLAGQPGGMQFAQALEAGAISGADALRMWQAQAKGQGPTKGVVVNGQLVNPITGEQIGDYRDADGGSAKDKSIARIKSAYGVDDQTAVGIVDGVLRVSRDPFDQSVIVTNLATGQSYSPQAQQGQPQQIPDASAIQQTELPPAPDASNAFGFEGMVKGAINSATDFAGMSPPFDGVQQTQSDFAVLREGLVNDISQGYGRQPPSWLLKNIQDLTPQAGSMMGPEAAQSKLSALQRSFETELAGIQRQLNTRISPQQQQVLSERSAALQSALGRVSSALGQFGGRASNTTRSGVQWRIEQ